MYNGEPGNGIFLRLLAVSFHFFFLVFIAAYPSQLVTSSHAAHQRPWPASCALATAPALSSYVQCGATINDLIFFSFFFFDRFSCQKAFRDVLTEVNDQAGQHEVVAENLTSAVTKEIVALVKDLKEERKKVI